MFTELHGRVFAPGVFLAALHGATASAQALPSQVIAETSIVDVPLVIEHVEAPPPGTTLWANGRRDQPALISTFVVRPVQAAKLAPIGDYTAEPVLWRAFPGGGVTRLDVDELPAEAPFYFCGGSAQITGLACFVDDDGDGRFDQAAQAISERGAKPYHVTMMRLPKRLGRPLSYRLLESDGRPAVKIELRNCGKDYDRPRFSALSTDDRSVPQPLTFGW